MKVYCDRLATVTVTAHGQFECPKCQGICNQQIDINNKFNRWDCVRCGLGWEKVPNHIKTEAAAEVYCMENS